jgi:lipopolysaccharide biosynthesis protein
LGYKIYCAPTSIVLHHLSKTTALIDDSFKNKAIQKNLLTLRKRWGGKFSNRGLRSIAFYLPQFHSIPENNEWWGVGFTEWRNVSKAEPNYEGHYQPRVPTDLGYYDLRVSDVMRAQVELAIKYGIEGFCFYYYWFDGKRLLERPVENYLNSPDIDFPFCVCWANENWTRRWDGREQEVLISQNHSGDDDRAVIKDLIRYFNDRRYIRIDGKPLILVYQVDYFPDFAKTSQIWREVCRQENVGEIYIAMVETFEFINKKFHPRDYGCDASVEFPPHGMAKSFENNKFKVSEDFVGTIADYEGTAINALTRESPDYVRFRGVIPSWDNTARRGNRSYIFEKSTPGLFQAWLEIALRLTFEERSGDERIVFINAWNEWAEGAYLEPDTRFGHAYLQAVKNAYDSLDLS